MSKLNKNRKRPSNQRPQKKEDQHRARKRFGQNFLNHAPTIENIINVIQPSPEDQMVEIGPGLGALTVPLLERLNTLRAIEIDRDLANRLRETYGPNSEHLKLIEADALSVDFSALADQGPIRIVGNLPYNISTPILFHLMKHKEKIVDMHFMLQKEVVERMVATSGNKQYGRLSVMLQYHCKIESLFDIPPSAFKPQPKVMSSIVRLTPLEKPILATSNLKLLGNIVSQAFNQRRKVLRNSLSSLSSVEQFEAAGIDPNKRAEQVDIESFVRLSNILDSVKPDSDSEESS